MQVPQLMDNSISHRLFLYAALGLSLILLIVLINVKTLVDVVPQSKSSEIFTVRLQVQGKALQNPLLSQVIEEISRLLPLK